MLRSLQPRIALRSAIKIAVRISGILIRTINDWMLIRAVKYSDEMPVARAMAPGKGPQQTIAEAMVTPEVHMPPKNPAPFGNADSLFGNGLILNKVFRSKTMPKRLIKIVRAFP